MREHDLRPRPSEMAGTDRIALVRLFRQGRSELAPVVTTMRILRFVRRPDKKINTRVEQWLAVANGKHLRTNHDVSMSE